MVVILIDNAVKYSGKNTEITIKTLSHAHSVDITVADHGLGISEQDLPHIFDRFYQADSARSRKQTDGYGLGLSIAKKIVHFHNGSLEANSRVGEGSVFTINLPK